MAINDTTANFQATQPNAPQGQPQGQPFNMDQAVGVGFNQNNTNDPVQGKMSFSTYANGSRGVIARNAGSEKVNQIIEKLTEIYKPQLEVLEFKLIPIDNTNYPGMRYSSIICCARVKTKLGVGVGVHTMIIEASGDDIPSVQMNDQAPNGNRSIEYLRPASTAWDANLFKKVQEIVNAAYPKVKQFFMDATVVPRMFNVENRNDMFNLARNTMLACTYGVDTATVGFADINLSQVQITNPEIVIGFERTQISDDVGMPQRSDIQMNFTDNNQPQGSYQQKNLDIVNEGERSQTIGRLSGFIDFSWSPAVSQDNMMLAQLQMNQQNMMGGGMNPLQMYQKYAARLVLTHIDPTVIGTLPAILFMVYAATAANYNMHWVQAFANKGGKKALGDIGALNYEANIRNNPNGIGDYIDTTLDTFRLEELYQLVSIMVQPNIAIALDIPDCGPQTWMLSSLSAAANGNPKEIANVIAAFDMLTGGNFSRVFPQNTSLFAGTPDRIHMGYYEEGSTIADARNVDYLAVLKRHGPTDPEQVRQWSDSFNAVNYYSLARRLDMRANIIRSIIPSVRFTGYATRPTFSKECVTALITACLANGVKPNIRIQGTPGVGIQADRGVAAFAANGLFQFGTNQAVFGTSTYGNNNFTNNYGFNTRMV